MDNPFLERIISGTPRDYRPIEIHVQPDGRTIVINGMKFSREFFEVLENPNPNLVYRIAKRGDVVVIESLVLDQ